MISLSPHTLQYTSFLPYTKMKLIKDILSQDIKEEKNKITWVELEPVLLKSNVYIKKQVHGFDAVYPFVSPKTKSRKKILASFRKTERYSHTFLGDLKEGLENSDYFEK